MSADASEMDPHFMQLVISLQAGAMQQMGKVANPMTGKLERNLEMAKATIDLLGMLEKKTAGNLADPEKKLLEHALYELRLNFVDESKKPDPDPGKQESDGAAKTETDHAESPEGDAPDKTE